MKNRAGWLALVVLAIASLLMVFFVLPRINHDAKPLGDAINAAGDAVKDAVESTKQAVKPTDAPNSPDAPKPQEQASVPAATPAAPVSPPASPSAPAAPSTPAAPAVTAPPSATSPVTTQPNAAQTPAKPAFDVLRVEPDGSAVIAGRALPNSTLEISSGNSVVAKIDVGPSGDFAAVLDKPLPPGDHQLVLKATGKDGKTVVSDETATVSVPSDPKTGKLLAMVTTPGKASRVIATPNASAPAAPNAATSPTPPAPDAAPSTAGQTAAGQSQTPAVTPALPQASSQIASSAPNVSAPSSTAAPDATPAPAGTPDLQITAVELEGSKIFIAGIARSGVTVRGLVDGEPVGQSRAGGNGHFVIEGNTQLSVGDHRISVEALNGAGQRSVMVEVPFNRPAGEQVAAVAAPAVSSPMSTIDGGAFEKLRNEVVRAFNLLQNLYADGKVPSGEQMAAARSSTSITLKSLTEYRLPADASVSARSVADNAAKDAASALAALDKVPNDVAAVGAALKDLGAMIARAVGPAMARQMDGGNEQEMAGTPAAPATGVDGTKTFQQAPLTQSERNSVIIRRGDTLWQISRRMYGQGVRYTTIYLANEDQIRNPDIIQPGQIFGVPEEFRPDSEELHRERIQHRK
ncbi:LysM peptidoglycan-binding domain-containing protein [Rhizobium sp. NFR12]|uniref:LysM peptidoglycan-binding domain-containing protein n=1 Tax=Rhizobium sp. NFR12 TaxID=1566261 RepID=UPI0008A80A03|nr:LysM peptidoglycan-binding domain-containing protein [Rhizobium sp. NFR12]SEH24329.1 LysM domain-containing protein [Rhizobium sp. NFR12]